MKRFALDTVKTRTTVEILNASLVEILHITSGHNHRIYVTASIANSTGKELETVAGNFNTVSY